MADSPEAYKKHIKLYTIIGLLLFFFTAFTVWIATVDLGSHALNIGVGLLVATVKATLVALIFMHLNHEKGLIYQILIYTFFFFLGLMILTMLAHYDPVFYPGFQK